MNLDEVVEKYKALGYVPKNVGDDEVDCLINWIYKKYDVFVRIQFINNNLIKLFKNENIEINKFLGCYIYNCNSKHPEDFSTHSYFDNLFDCKVHIVEKLFDALSDDVVFKN